MAALSTRNVRRGLIAFGTVMLAGLVVIFIQASGLLPGDRGVEPTTADPGVGGVMNLAAWPWTVIIVIGTLVLGLAIAYGQFRAGRLSREESERADAGAGALREREERGS